MAAALLQCCGAVRLAAPTQSRSAALLCSQGVLLPVRAVLCYALDYGLRRMPFVSSNQQ